MSEAEFYVLPARLNGGVRNKAARSELRRGLPVGLRPGARPMAKSVLDPDEGVRSTIASVFTRFAKTRSARRAPLGFRSEGLWACRCGCISGARSVGGGKEGYG